LTKISGDLKKWQSVSEKKIHGWNGLENVGKSTISFWTIQPSASKNQSALPSCAVLRLQWLRTILADQPVDVSSWERVESSSSQP
jgi:hypothetical protein